MKNAYRLFLLAVTGFIVYTGCKNPPMFAAIEQEVKLKKASVTGTVRGLVKIGNDLYVSNGRLFTKKVGNTGSWSTVSAPGTSGSLAVDSSDNLYGIFDYNTAYIRLKDQTDWKKYDTPLQVVAGTDTVFAQGKDAAKLYVLTTTTATAINGNDFGVLKTAAGDYCGTTKGIYDRSGVKQNGGAPTGGVLAMCKGKDNAVFAADSSKLYLHDGSSWSSMQHGVSSPAAITYLASKQLVLIAGSSGFAEIVVKADSSGSLTLNDAQKRAIGSEQSSIPRQYLYQYQHSVGKWPLNPLFAVEKTSPAEGYILYAGVLDSNARYTGLWGFYNPGQLEWNRE